MSKLYLKFDLRLSGGYLVGVLYFFFLFQSPTNLPLGWKKKKEIFAIYYTKNIYSVISVDNPISEITITREQSGSFKIRVRE